jgi:hypothetical protein
MGKIKPILNFSWAMAVEAVKASVAQAMALKN